MSGRWTAVCGSASTAAPAGARPARQSTSREFSQSPSLGHTRALAFRSSTQAPRGLYRHYAWAEAIDPADADLSYVAVSRGPSAAHGNGDGQSPLLRSRGGGWEAVDGWGDAPELRRMPYALVTLPDRPGRLLAGLRGGTVLITDEAGDTWSLLPVRLPELVDLATAPT